MLGFVVGTIRVGFSPHPRARKIVQIRFSQDADSEGFPFSLIGIPLPAWNTTQVTLGSEPAKWIKSVDSTQPVEVCSIDPVSDLPGEAGVAIQGRQDATGFAGFEEWVRHQATRLQIDMDAAPPSRHLFILTETGTGMPVRASHDDGPSAKFFCK